MFCLFEKLTQTVSVHVHAQPNVELLHIEHKQNKKITWKIFESEINGAWHFWNLRKHKK